MEQISLLIPSRGRPKRLVEMMHSAYDKAYYPHLLEFCLGLDMDDSQFNDYKLQLTHAKIPTPQIMYNIASQQTSAPRHTNKLATMATGSLLFGLGDDVIFRTAGWDQVICDFWHYCEKTQGHNYHIFYCNDGRNREKCEHFIIHSDWIKHFGHICPDYFRHFCIDAWVEDIAIQLGTLHMLPHVIVEHMHFKYGKSERDTTYDAIRQPLKQLKGDTVITSSVSEQDTQKFHQTHGERIAAAQALRIKIQKQTGIAPAFQTRNS